MPIADKRSFVLGLMVGCLILGLDQASKWAMLQLMAPRNFPILQITPFFNLAVVWNRGISFGMFADHHQPLLLIALALGITCILLKWLYKNTSPYLAAALGCIIGGAIGNVVDRFRFGAVVDFVDVHIGVYHWPAFNIADSAIFIGVVLLCLSSIIHPTVKS